MIHYELKKLEIFGMNDIRLGAGSACDKKWELIQFVCEELVDWIMFDASQSCGMHFIRPRTNTPHTENWFG